MNLRPTLLLFVLLSSAATHAQLAPAPDAPPAATVPETPQPKSTAPEFQIRANLVNLYFVARGQNKKLIPNLTQNDCTITEDNTPQIIQSFTAENHQPLTLGILLDTSLSQQRVLSTEKQAAAAFLRRILHPSDEDLSPGTPVLHPSDEAFLIAFDVDVTMLADFTSSPGKLKKAIDGAGINSTAANYANGTIPSIGKPKGTLLYDAIELAATEKLRPEAGRKALVLLTNGVDEGSQTRLRPAIESAQKANAVVYVLLIQDPGLYGVIEETNAGPMQRLAQATGGQVFKIGSNGRKMQAAFEEIETELRSQYQATYTPTNRAADGSWRRIQIRCLQHSEPLKVQARQGYYAQSK